MRLNHAIYCPGCKMQINPFVDIWEGGLEDDQIATCGNCGEIFKVGKRTMWVVIK